MAGQYGSLACGQHTNADIMDEMQRAGPYGGRPGPGPCGPQAAYGQGPAQDAYREYPAARYPPGFDARQAAAEAVFDSIDRNHDGKVTQEEWRAAFQGSASSAEHQQQQSHMYGPDGLFAGAVDVFYGDRHVVGERMVDHRQQVISGVRPIYTYEKIVEVPQTIVKEYDVEVVKPQLLERIIEVPKPVVKERTVVGPPQVQYQEQLVERVQEVVEERVVHVPRREVQERLIEVPKVEYVERIEYDDYIEYREVVVDKIIEVPEIEYHVREVEHPVPQTYIQEYYIDRYVEVPITQVQEVAREERVPMSVPVPKGSFGPPRTVADGGEMFAHMARNGDGRISDQDVQLATQSMGGGQQAYGSQVYGAQMGASQMYDAQMGASQMYDAQMGASQMYDAQRGNYAFQSWGQSPSFGQGQQPMGSQAGLLQSYASYEPGAGCSAGYGPGPMGGAEAAAEAERQRMQATIAAAPVGSVFAVPKGTFRQGQSSAAPVLAGSMPPGSMQAIPGYSTPPMSGVPTPPGSYGQSLQSTAFGQSMPPGPGYNPFATMPPVPAY